VHPQRLKPNSKQCAYRSGEPLRHPKSTARATFCASCEAVPFPSALPKLEKIKVKVKVKGSGQECPLYTRTDF
jgi:hypothetical protein